MLADFLLSCGRQVVRTSKETIDDNIVARSASLRDPTLGRETNRDFHFCDKPKGIVNVGSRYSRGPY